MKATSWTRQLLLAGIVVLVSGCATTSPIATNTPTPAAPLVVLLGGDRYPTHVSIVDMSGHEVAGADFNAVGHSCATPPMFGRQSPGSSAGRSISSTTPV